jgi:hypothetical protein
MGTAAHAPFPTDGRRSCVRQCAEMRFRPHQTKESPPSPTSSTPAVMGRRPVPAPSSPSGMAAACVGLADLVMGLFQLDSALGPAVVAVGLGEAVVASAVAVSSAVATGSGARVGSGAGAGAAGTCLAGGPGTGTSGWAGAGSWVGLGSGFSSLSTGAVVGCSHDSHAVAVGSAVGDSAYVASTVPRPTASATPTAATLAETARSIGEYPVMATFSTARGTPSATISVPGSLLQHAVGPQIPAIRGP